ncbi:MAG TPA: hypothetical protein PL151_16760 [Phycisphaerae bacterium]|nr:hypothetical protein [Phycisphaerae bacterium]HOJ75665.1 hypothetical protein [Phycisphaerae bacterium]HOM52533.1 hypothetical protein [Phycisphaerae bacterium]HON66409.1 hypothetical protein [Phycisphaerae bacterium]HOQ86832.1 hypothetical protein [Phycisphaerae bacterium]
MKLGAKNASTSWKAVSLAVVCALMLGPLTACDEEVSATLISGLNEAANGVAVTLIDAAFKTVTPKNNSSNNGNDGGSSGGNSNVPQV